MQPNDEETHVRLGDAYLAKNKVDEAIKENEKALAINPRGIAQGSIWGRHTSGKAG